MTDCNKQANDFLAATSTSFKAEFKKHDYYFDGDKDKRDVYRITLKNSRHTYRFDFGQAIAKVGTPPHRLRCFSMPYKIRSRHI